MDYVLVHYDMMVDILLSVPVRNSLVIQLAWLCDINPSCVAFNDNGYLPKKHSFPLGLFCM